LTALAFQAQTLEDAVGLVQRRTPSSSGWRRHSNQQPLAQFRQQIARRGAGSQSPQGQFEPIANMVTNMVLPTRGGTDQTKVRTLLQSVAQIRVSWRRRVALKQHTVT
jgi:hypothetical protein